MASLEGLEFSFETFWCHPDRNAWRPVAQAHCRGRGAPRRHDYCRLCLYLIVGTGIDQDNMDIVASFGKAVHSTGFEWLLPGIFQEDPIACEALGLGGTLNAQLVAPQDGDGTCKGASAWKTVGFSLGVCRVVIRSTTWHHCLRRPSLMYQPGLECWKTSQHWRCNV